MVIRGQPMFQPLVKGAASVGPANFAVPARSLAAQRIADEMEQYALDQIAGRSFLAAGHRGSGKTSAVNNAVSEVSSRLSSSVPGMAGTLSLHIADVRLHGPDLIAPISRAAKDDLALRDTKQMLRQITLAL